MGPQGVPVGVPRKQSFNSDPRKVYLLELCTATQRDDALSMRWTLLMGVLDVLGG